MNCQVRLFWDFLPLENFSFFQVATAAPTFAAKDASEVDALLILHESASATDVDV